MVFYTFEFGPISKMKYFKKGVSFKMPVYLICHFCME